MRLSSVQFTDGFAYSKGKLEEAYRNGLLDKPPAKPAKDAVGPVKREDVDLIVGLHRFSFELHDE